MKQAIRANYDWISTLMPSESKTSIEIMNYESLTRGMSLVGVDVMFLKMFLR